MKKIYYGWWVVGGGFIQLFCQAGTFFYAFPIFYEALLRDMGWSRAETAAAFSVAMFVLGISGPVIGSVIHKIGVRVVMVSGSILAGIGFFLMSTITAPWQFYIYYGVILTVGISGIQVVPIFTVIERWFVRKRSMAMGIASMGVGVSGAVMAPLASFLISRYSWQITYIFAAVLVTLIGTIVSITIMRFPREGEIYTESIQKTTGGLEELLSDERTFSQALKTKQFWLISIAVWFWGWAYTAGLVHQVAFAVDLGVDRIAAAGAVGLIPAFSIIGRLVFGKMGDAIDNRYVFMMAACFQVAGYIVLVMSANLAMIYVYSILLGLNLGGIFLSIAGLTTGHFGSKNFGVIYGAFFACLLFGEMIGPLYAGWIYDNIGSYTSAFMTNILMSSIAIILVYLSGKAPSKSLFY
ncbi:MFS transporter [Chloroflexota bacterium]